MTADPTTPPSNGLKTVLDTIVSPKEAFESMRIVPTWGWALAITIVLATIGSYLMIPAFQHAFEAGWPAMVAKDPNLAQLPADRQQAILAMNSKIFGFAWIFPLFFIPIICLVEALVMLIFNAIGRGDGTYAKYFSAACNISVPTAGLAAIIGAVVVVIRGANSFGSMPAVQGAMPSLATFGLTSDPKLTAFLGQLNPFSLWAVGLSVAAMIVIGRVPKLQAWLAAIVMFLVPTLIAVGGAK